MAESNCKVAYAPADYSNQPLQKGLLRKCDTTGLIGRFLSNLISETCVHKGAENKPK